MVTFCSNVSKLCGIGVESLLFLHMYKFHPGLTKKLIIIIIIIRTSTVTTEVCILSKNLLMLIELNYPCLLPKTSMKNVFDIFW